jgi:hypothetical protein
MWPERVRVCRAEMFIATGGAAVVVVVVVVVVVGAAEGV